MPHEIMSEPAITSPNTRSTRSIKRDNEGNLKSDPSEAASAAASNENGAATATAEAPLKPSPTSEVKKQNAAMSLTQLFTTTQDSLTSVDSGGDGTLGEAGNFLAECFSGDGDGEHGHLAHEPHEATQGGEGAPEEAAAGEVGSPTRTSPRRKKAKGAMHVSTEGAAEQGKNQETPLAMKAGAYRLNKLMEATKFTSPIPEHPTAPPPQQEAPPPLQQLKTEVPLEAEMEELPAARRIAGNRKEKSLALLCQNFMDLCRDAPPCGPNDESGALVELNELAAHLGVKRRRIYDIINIMESVNIVSRLKKNTYRWHGTENLPVYFARLQKEGLEELQSGIRPEKQIKGMSLTCQKLIQYFLTTGVMEIRLADAAEAVLGPSDGEEKSFKTKIRRMYDIANVLTSLGIIRKENVAGSSAKAQPSFRWVYPISPQEMSQHLPAGEKMEGLVLVPHIPPQEAVAPALPQAERLSLDPEEEETESNGNRNPVTPEERAVVMV